MLNNPNYTTILFTNLARLNTTVNFKPVTDRLIYILILL